MGAFRQQGKLLALDVLVGKWGLSNRGSARITPEALPGQPQNRFWNGKEKWVFHLLDLEERAGVCRAALTFRDWLGGSQDPAHACGLCAHS